MNGVTLQDVFSHETVESYAKILSEFEKNFDILPERLKLLFTTRKKELADFKLMSDNIRKFQPDEIISHYKDLLIKEAIVDIMRSKNRRKYLNKLAQDNYQRKFLKNFKGVIVEATQESIVKALAGELDDDLPPNSGTDHKPEDPKNTPDNPNPKDNPNNQSSASNSDSDKEDENEDSKNEDSKNKKDENKEDENRIEKNETTNTKTQNIKNCNIGKEFNSFNITLEEEISIVLLLMLSQTPPNLSQTPPNHIIRNVNWGVRYGGYS